jgi:hypothetical protein
VEEEAAPSPFSNNQHSACKEIQEILQQFGDVLVGKLPEGLPPERYAADGTTIEHTIDIDPDERPFATKPRLLSREENAELQRQLTALFDAGAIVPSLSSLAFPVLFVRKKPDPLTGVSGYHMCTNYVKLNNVTKNRIAYRLPRIAELLTG